MSDNLLPSGKTKYPFPNLPSLLLTREVLSYFDYFDGAEELCEILCKNSQHYWKDQMNIIRISFATDERHSKMNLAKLLEFGWERKRSDEIVHFLSNPPPPL